MQSNQSFVSIANQSVATAYSIANSYMQAAKKSNEDFLKLLVDKNKAATQTEEDKQLLDWLKSLPDYEPEEPNEPGDHSLEELRSQNAEANKGPYVLSKGARTAYGGFKDYINTLAAEIDFKCPGPEEEYELLEKERQRLISDWEQGIWPSIEYRKFTHLKNKRDGDLSQDFCFKDYREQGYQLCLLVNSLIDRWGWDGESFKRKAQNDLTHQFAEFLNLELKIAFLVDRLKYLKAGDQPNSPTVKNNSEQLNPYKAPLSLAQIALYHKYQGKDIDKSNANEALANTKFTSIEKLIEKFNGIRTRTDRIGYGNAAGVTHYQRVKDIKRVIDELTDNNLMDAAGQAKEELYLLQENIKQHEKNER